MKDEDLENLIERQDQRNHFLAVLFAIDSVVALEGEDLSFESLRINHLSYKQLKELFLRSVKVIEKIYQLSHGIHCCKEWGKQELLKSLKNEAVMFMGVAKIKPFIKFINDKRT